jgi:hypothetical protein
LTVQKVKEVRYATSANCTRELYVALYVSCGAGVSCEVCAGRE